VTSTVNEIKALGRHCHVYNCDLANRADILSIVDRVCKQDRHEVDILVHSGGIQHRSPAATFPDDKWDDILNVNLTAGFLLSREFAAHWLSTTLSNCPPPLPPPEGPQAIPAPPPVERKKIIFIGSVLCFSGSMQVPAYVATKGAIAGVTRALNNEWMRQGINVNALAPGYIETELTSGIREDGEKERAVLKRVPLGRWGVPEDLAGAVVHLAGRGSDFVGGEVYVIDGGFNAR
jgi:2-dehydro-3-deoxy-D-gluconate 5-dehydrogenase